MIVVQKIDYWARVLGRASVLWKLAQRTIELLSQLVQSSLNTPEVGEHGRWFNRFIIFCETSLTENSIRKWRIRLRSESSKPCARSSSFIISRIVACSSSFSLSKWRSRAPIQQVVLCIPHYLDWVSVRLVQIFRIFRNRFDSLTSCFRNTCPEICLSQLRRIEFNRIWLAFYSRTFYGGESAVKNRG